MYVKGTRGNIYGETRICVRDSRKGSSSHTGWYRTLEYLSQEMVDAPVNAFKGSLGRLDKLRQTRVGFSWTNPLSPWPHRMIGSPVRPHKAGKVRYFSLIILCILLSL